MTEWGGLAQPDFPHCRSDPRSFRGLAASHFPDVCVCVHVCVFVCVCLCIDTGIFTSTKGMYRSSSLLCKYNVMFCYDEARLLSPDQFDSV